MEREKQRNKSGPSHFSGQIFESSVQVECSSCSVPGNLAGRWFGSSAQLLVCVCVARDATDASKAIEFSLIFYVHNITM